MLQKLAEGAHAKISDLGSKRLMQLVGYLHQLGHHDKGLLKTVFIDLKGDLLLTSISGSLLQPSSVSKDISKHTAVHNLLFKEICPLQDSVPVVCSGSSNNRSLAVHMLPTEITAISDWQGFA